MRVALAKRGGDDMSCRIVDLDVVKSRVPGFFGLGLRSHSMNKHSDE